jgi:hypothetical protein
LDDFTSDVIYKYFLSKQKDYRDLRSLFIPIVISMSLLISSVLGIFTAYWSPITGSPNDQFSYSQQAGLKFFVNNAVVDSRKIDTITANIAILSSILTPEEFEKLRRTYTNWRFRVAPAHFDFESDYSQDYKNPGYILVTAPEKAYYTEIWPEGGRFTPNDFESLDNDLRWNRVYTTNDITIWFWNSVKR